MITGLKVSKRLTDFINFYDEMILAYQYAYDMVNQCDKLKCDLLHKLELKMYADRNEKRRIQTQLEYCLQDRRYYKDRVEELEPFANIFLDKSKDNQARSAQNKTCINMIKGSLGAIRKAEGYHTYRTYKPRILKDMFGEDDV